jgi:hypothetical protein
MTFDHPYFTTAKSGWSMQEYTTLKFLTSIKQIFTFNLWIGSWLVSNCHLQASDLDLDAPCSGTGTLRRNAELKWTLTPQIIEQFVQKQQEIFVKALQFLKPGGYP